MRKGLFFQVDAPRHEVGVDPHVCRERVGMAEQTMQRVVVGRAFLELDTLERREPLAQAGPSP